MVLLRAITEHLHAEVPVGDVMSCPNRLGTLKADGPDGIPPQLIKECSTQIAPGLCVIFNQSICTGQIPKELKSADVQCNIHPLKECKGSCRKFTVHLASAHCEQSSGATGFQSSFNHPKKVITHLKHRFLRSYSCVTQLLSVLHEIGEYLHKHMQTDIIYLDFAKAFDSADHNVVLAKLRACSAMV